MLTNIVKWARLSLLFYLTALITVSVMPLGRVSHELTDITVIHLRGDYFLHLLVYMPLLTLFLISFQRWKWKMFFLAVAMAVGLEFIQKALPYRSFNINDLIANLSGVIVGGLLALLLIKSLKKD